MFPSVIHPGVIDLHQNAGVGKYPAWHAVDVERGAIGGYRHHPIADLQFVAVEFGYAVVLECPLAEANNEEAITLKSILLYGGIGHDDAALALGGADVMGNENLRMEDLMINVLHVLQDVFGTIRWGL